MAREVVLGVGAVALAGVIVAAVGAEFILVDSDQDAVACQRMGGVYVCDGFDCDCEPGVAALVGSP